MTFSLSSPTLIAHKSSKRHVGGTDLGEGEVQYIYQISSVGGLGFAIWGFTHDETNVILMGMFFAIYAELFLFRDQLFAILGEKRKEESKEPVKEEKKEGEGQD